VLGLLDAEALAHLGLEEGADAGLEEDVAAAGSSRTSMLRQARLMRLWSSGGDQRAQTSRGQLPNIAPPSRRWVLPSSEKICMAPEITRAVSRRRRRRRPGGSLVCRAWVWALRLAAARGSGEAVAVAVGHVLLGVVADEGRAEELRHEVEELHAVVVAAGGAHEIVDEGGDGEGEEGGDEAELGAGDAGEAEPGEAGGPHDVEAGLAREGAAGEAGADEGAAGGGDELGLEG
jgi:hypothetical protein